LYGFHSSKLKTHRIAIHIAANILNHNAIQITTGAEFGMKDITALSHPVLNVKIP
jgi:hypothetical protein